jgi:membrane-bound lytic murein transglycosylase MltF
MLVVVSAIALASTSDVQAAGKTTSTAPHQAVVDSKPWKGDFDGMLQRRRIRMLVPYSRTLFYVEKGQKRGLSAELAHDFETYLNKKFAKQLAGQRFTVSLIPTTRDKLLSGLNDGMGDISGGNLTETAARGQIADFVVPTESAPATEVLVTGRNAPPVVASPEGLSGKKVNVRESSSYFESLNALNDKLSAASRPGVQIITMPDALEDEDLLEMMNAGLFDFTVMDSWKAKLWAQNAHDIHVHEDVVLRSGGTIGWAIRKQSPKLQAAIEGFYQSASQQGLMEARLTAYQQRLKEISSSSAVALKHFDETMDLFRKYGSKYAFDPLMMAAEGQTLPASDEELAGAVQAATKHTDELMSQSFPDAKFSDADRTLFAFASYKLGADKIVQMRKEAAKRGLDPNQWFNNVEQVTAEKLGMAATAYVRNIYKYQTAYKLIAESEKTAAQK